MEQSNTIGTLLKTYRENKKISIEEIAQRTKININILKSLEEDDLNNLPNKTYVRGFVTNYAKTIGLDINEARNSLENTYNIKFGHLVDETTPQKTLGALQADNPEEDETEEIKETLISIIQGFLNKKIIYGIVAVFVVLIIGKGIVSFFSQLSFERNNITSTEEKSTKPVLKDKNENLFDLKASKKLAADLAKQEKNINTAKAEEAKKEEVAKKVVKKEEPKKVEPKKEKISEKPVKKDEKPIIKLPPGKFPFKKFYPAPKKMYSIVPNAPEVDDASILPPNIKASAISGKQNVYIVATEQDTWISYKADDRKIKRFVLKQGRRVLIKGDRILLFMGNFNAAKVFLNNELISAKTRTGVKSMIFPEEDAVDFELPLFPSYKGVPYSAEDYKANMVTEETSI